jgi:dUTP pyrophosphatase
MTNFNKGDLDKLLQELTRFSNVTSSTEFDVDDIKYDLNKDDKFKLPIKFINKSSNQDPSYSKDGDSGFDLRAEIDIDEYDALELTDDNDIILHKMCYLLVNTGLYFEIPKGYELQVRPRSGLSAKHGITVLNSPGTVDSGYRGEVKVILYNLGYKEFIIKQGDRIAQAVIAPVCSTDIINLQKTDKLDDSERGKKGFGSTGKK